MSLSIANDLTMASQSEQIQIETSTKMLTPILIGFN